MKNTKNKIALLSVGACALVLMGAGCEGMFNTNTSLENDDAMMEENKSGDTMMKGDVMNDDDNMVGGDAMVDGDDAMMEKDEDSMMEDNDDSVMMEQSSAGSFEAYSEEKLSRANEGRVVLAFFADWCPTCRAAKADINANMDAIPAGVTILDVDYDNATALRQKYGVTTQHTFVEVDAEGNMLQTWRGGNTLESITEKVS